ncbi:mechanosensitive ion channel domain-containing protein [Telmatospirillum sp. J64-1]|uniref:mechanosensitive ion channel domain-containing protein n=1 Tax=Telmatospirillum sp. J64-1 TaxID=2502183 RepID=UPI001C8F886F|nr:mechanosensitive ion channel domain-containing protein [Telmatospirillum sp. J64-1]
MASFPAQAQTETPPPASQQATAQDLERLVATLEDEQARERLLNDLRGLLAVQRETAADEPPETLGARVLAVLAAQIDATSQQLANAVGAASDLPQAMEALTRTVADPVERDRWLGVTLRFLGILVAGYAAQLFAELLMRRPSRAVEARSGMSMSLRLPLAVLHVLIDLVPLVAFTIAAYLVMPILQVTGQTQVAALMLTTAYVLVRGIMAVARVLLAPRVAAVRMVPVSDETAGYLWVWVRRLSQVTIFGYFLVEASRLLGLPAPAAALLLKLLGLMVAMMLIIFIMQNRQQVGMLIRGRPDMRTRMDRRLQGLRNRLGDVWHVLAVLYVVVLFGIYALDVEGGFAFVIRATVLSAVIIALALLVAAGLHKLVGRAFAICKDMSREFPQLEARANRYLPVLHTALRLFVALFTVLALLQAWGLDGLAMLGTPAGGRMVSAVITISIVLIIALVVWELVSSAIERYLGQVDEQGNAVIRSARARTLLPLARNALLVLMVVMVSLIVLAELGINIAPLLAGAGVIGLAVGFGAQTLVKDIITGAFILFEDTISVGDVIDLGNGHSGSVEGISIRTIRLRDVHGSVHTVPFSSVGSIKNLTREFSFYLLEVGVAYREDTDEVVQVLQEILEEMRQDETCGPKILEPLEVQGVDRFTDSAVIIRARIKTLPIQQWAVGREFNRRMKKRFDELGIEIPFPHTTIYFGEDKKGNAPPARLRLERDPQSGQDGPSGVSRKSEEEAVGAST